MNIRGGVLVVIIVLTCACSARYGRLRRESGRPVTPRDMVYVMAIAWAVGWLAIGLPALLDWGRYVPWQEVIPAGSSLIALATAPLVLVLAATWLPRLNAPSYFGHKKTGKPHPLD